jgi:hypothetical protein
MALRNMPEPGMDDSGGNPLQEGILGDYQHPSRRDESFASVQSANEPWDRAYPFANATECPKCGGLTDEGICPHCGHQDEPDFELTGVMPPEDGSVRSHNERMDKQTGFLDDVVNNSPLAPTKNFVEDVASGKNVLDSAGNAAVDAPASMVPGAHALLHGTGVENWMHQNKWPLLGGAALAALAIPTGGADLAAAGAGAGATAEGTGMAAGAEAGVPGALGSSEGAAVSSRGVGSIMRNAWNKVPGGDLGKYMLLNHAEGMGKGMLNNMNPMQNVQAPQMQVQPDSAYSHVAAEEELKTPSSRDDIGNDEENDYDSKEHDDGDDSKHLEVGSDINDMGGSDQGPDGFAKGSPGMEQMAGIFPLIMHYLLSGEEGGQDPQLQELHQALEQENPGYMDKADDQEGNKVMMMILKPGDQNGLQDNDKPHDPISDDDEVDQLKAAALEAHTRVALNEFPGQRGGPPGMAQTGKCANCGATLDPSNGGCPQCGFRNPLQMSQPTNPDLQTPQQMAVAKTATETQGPVTDEQKALLSEYLIQQGREDEVPAMLLNPAEYADELAEVVGKDTPPTPPEDPTPPPSVPPQGADQGGMPMPGMGAPGGGAGPMMAAIARYASSVDVAAEPCPECGSHTTGYKDEKGHCLCHSCGHEYSGTGLVNLDKTTRTAEDHGHPYNMENEIGVPAGDQQGQEDVEREQDSGHTWVDDQGNPLKVGQEYEMYSSNYDIPDIVRIEDVKPDAVDYTLTGEYGLEHRTEISYEESQLEGIHFVPSHEGHDQQEQDPGLEENMDDIGRPSPGMNQTDLSTPHVMSSEKEATPFLPDESLTNGKWELPQHARGVGEGYDPLHTPQGGRRCICAYPQELDGSCMKCGGVVDEGQAYAPENLEPVTDENRFASETGPDWLAEEVRTAGAKFTPFEQRTFIDEQGMARNSEKLDLTGTHYEMDELDPNFLFGL